MSKRKKKVFLRLPLQAKASGQFSQIYIQAIMKCRGYMITEEFRHMPNFNVVQTTMQTILYAELRMDGWMDP